MKFKDFKYCIITDEDSRPMSFDYDFGALSYCNDEFWQDEFFPLKVVTIKTAQKQIDTSITNRKKWGLESPEYKLIPVAKK